MACDRLTTQSSMAMLLYYVLMVVAHHCNVIGEAPKASKHDAMSAKLVNRPTFLDYGNYRFLIMDAPTDQNLPAYIEVLLP
jgi:hypothetical protein